MGVACEAEQGIMAVSPWWMRKDVIWIIGALLNAFVYWCRYYGIR
jgi:hypothetical protein